MPVESEPSSKAIQRRSTRAFPPHGIPIPPARYAPRSSLWFGNGDSLFSPIPTRNRIPTAAYCWLSGTTSNGRVVILTPYPVHRSLRHNLLTFHHCNCTDGGTVK